MDTRKHIGDFVKIPDEIITGFITQSITVNDIKKLKVTCKFFSKNVYLDQAIEKKSRKSLKIAANLCHTFILKEGIVYVLGRANNFIEQEILVFNKPHQLSLPNERPIVKIVTGSTYAFFLDDLGNPFAFGDYRNSPLGVPFMSSYLDKPTAITFDHENKYSSKIIKIEILEHYTFFITENSAYYMAASDSFYTRSYARCHPRFVNSCAFPSPKVNNEMNLCSIALPSNKKITHIISGSLQHRIYGDEEGNWYGIGNNFYNRLGLGEEIKQVDELTPIDFYGMITSKEKLYTPKPPINK